MMLKGYVIGFSSGFFSVAEAGERESLMTMPRKMFKGAVEGVNFTQVDMESITELNEPYLQEGIKRMKNLGLRLGFHGESYAMGGGEKPMGMLDSSLEVDYFHSHQRLIQHIKGCGSLGGEFVNIHPSETTPYIRLGKDMQPTKLVDPWGRPFRKFLEENPKILEWAIEAIDKNVITAAHIIRYKNVYINDVVSEKMQKNRDKEFTEDEKKEIKREAFKRLLFDYVDSNDLEYGAEKTSYIIIAKWMQQNKDYLWESIVGKKIEDEKLDAKSEDWVPAVSAKYIWGHFNPKDTGTYTDPKPLLQKYGIYFVFETQMGQAGVEGLFRLMRPRDMALLCKAIGSPWVGVCFDFEHVLSQNIEPKKEIESIPYGLASYVKVCHLGWPTPHVPAHMPIPIGSEAHVYLYDVLFDLRKKGMKNAWFIYERASAGRETTILAMRMLKKFLENDVPPKELPLEFFGMDEKGPDIRRQEVTIREHFLDPIKGMLVVPEEEYTFLSKAATEKGKAEVWKKEQFR
jgi:hypothetical protein